MLLNRSSPNRPIKPELPQLVERRFATLAIAIDYLQNLVPLEGYNATITPDITPQQTHESVAAVTHLEDYRTTQGLDVLADKTVDTQPEDTVNAGLATATYNRNGAIESAEEKVTEIFAAQNSTSSPAHSVSAEQGAPPDYRISA